MSYSRKRSMSGLGTYSALGAEKDRPAAQTYCANKFGAMSADYLPCIAHYVDGKPGDYVDIKTQSYQNAGSGGGFFTDFFKTLVSQPATPTQPMYAPPAPSSGVSTTTLLVAGGAALILVALIASRN